MNPMQNKTPEQRADIARKNDVIYVGQAVNVFGRIGQHKDKNFNKFAYIPCSVDMMDKLESLYIHCLRPKLNGTYQNNTKCAPIPLDVLLGSNDD